MIMNIITSAASLPASATESEEVGNLAEPDTARDISRFLERVSRMQSS